MNSLLRQWPFLEAFVIPTLMVARPVERLIAWNMAHIDDALAVALAHMHYRGGQAAGKLFVFHSGAPPARRPVEWSLADIRGVPRCEWVEPSAGQRSRWTPHRGIMESVILSPPCQPVDLLISNQTRPWTGHDGVSPAELVRQGGFVLLAEAPAVGTVPADRFEPMDRNGQLLRKLTPPTRNHITATIPSRAFTLAAHHDQAMLVDRYSNLARSLARRFAGRGERIEDLEQVALLALVKAAGRYDPARERPFGAFATACILGEIKRHFRDKLWMVRVPRSVQETHLAIRAARDELSHVNGKSPTIKQIAEYIGASEEAVLTAMEAVTNTWTRSLDAPGRDDEDPVTDVPAIDQRFEHALDHRVLKESVSQLSPTERLILKRVFFDECTQRQVADELGVSQMQISRIITKTLNKMRETFQPA